MITKNLLSLVTNENITNSPITVKDNDLHFEAMRLNGFPDLVLNLDTLGRLCKEWCWKQEYDFVSSIGDKGLCVLHDDVNVNYINSFTGDTELEAIIKATEWVAKEKGLI